MKSFLVSIVKNLLIVLLFLELTIRVLNLTDDVPYREFDSYGLQVYQTNQSGKSHGYNWKTNEYGFLSHTDIAKDNQLLIIGDSFIENFMNPRECNQSSLFKNKGYNTFEIGRSGITFIEALEFYKNYAPIVKPTKTLIYVGNNDIVESISNIKRHKDRLQIDLQSKELKKTSIKGKQLKKILYSYKTLYYLYLKHKKSGKSNPQENKNYSNEYAPSTIKAFFKYINNNYDLEKTTFIFRKNNDYKEFFIENQLSYIELNMNDPKYIFPKDSHWNCHGHLRANKIILKKIFNSL